MSTSTQPAPSQHKYDERTIVNFPNEVTTARLALSIVLFVVLHLANVSSPSNWYWVGFWLFLITASTDWLDGFWARRYGQITILGRMLDPFVDKVVICGTFIFLAADPNSGLDGLDGGAGAGPRIARHRPAQLSRAARCRFFRRDFRQAQVYFAMRGRRASLFWLSYQPSHPPLSKTISADNGRFRHRSLVGAMDGHHFSLVDDRYYDLLGLRLCPGSNLADSGEINRCDCDGHLILNEPPAASGYEPLEALLIKPSPPA